MTRVRPPLKKTTCAFCRLGKGGVFLFLALLLGSPGGVAAQENETQRVRAAGIGSIIDQDVAQARDQAIADARVKALEKAVGVYVESETLLKNELLLDSAIRDQTAGFIQDYQVLSETEHQDEDLYKLEIEAQVVPREFQGKLKGLLSNVSIIVQIQETLCQRAVDAPRVENEVINRLTAEGFQVLDQEQARRLNRRDVELVALHGDREAAARMGLKFLSNIIVSGVAEAHFGQETSGIVSPRIEGFVRVIEADTARILANQRMPSRVPGAFGLNCEDAGGKALDKLALDTAEVILEKLKEHFRENQRRITLEATGLKNLNDFRRLKAFLGELRWVSEVEEGIFQGPTGRVPLIYPEKIVYLATSLNRRPEYKLISFDENSIFLRVQ